MISTTSHDSVVLVEIDRHERRNALDIEHLDELRGAVTGAANDGARSIVITGRGTSFSGGADLNGVYGEGFRVSLYDMLGAITALTIPVIAAVNGPAIGVGTQLAIACDLRVAASGAVFSVPTARNGLAVDPWTIRRLALLAGGGQARSLLLGATTLTADEAARHGLVDRIGDTAAALAWAKEIADLAPLTLAYSKRALEALFEPREWPVELDAAFRECWDSSDVTEAQRARAEKRPAIFSGR